MPVKTATSERSFRVLKLVNTYLRTSKQENWLIALALLYINNDIKLDYSQVIGQFVKGDRRLNLKQTDFVFWFIFTLQFHSSDKSRKNILKLAFRMHKNAYF